MGNDPHPTRPTPVAIERKLAAILSADVQGFSRLMGADEEATLRTLHAHREVTDALIQQHRGRIVGTAGDSILAEFVSAIAAMQCAVAIQRKLKIRNAELPAHRRMEFRIGINLGDVMVDGDQIYGDGVNIAARLQALAEAGGICISGTVYEQVRNKLALGYEDLGEQQVKNIDHLVRVWGVVEVPSPLVGEGQGEGAVREAGSSKFQVSGSKSKDESQKPRKVGIAYVRWVVAGLILIAGTLVAVRYFSRPPLSPQSSALVTQEAPALPLPDKPSIVVLPFVNISGEPNQEYFSDGLTEVLTSDLSKISSLFIISRNSAFTYKSKPVKMPEVSKELGVQYVVEGSVLKAGDQVRITVQLIDATQDHHLWSERYDRPLKDIFALQDEIVQKIVTTLKLQLTLREQGILVRKTTDNLEAYDYYLRGIESFYRLTKEANAQARQMFEKAIVLDPQYAEAYALLGGTYIAEWLSGWSQDPQNLERAFELAQRAVALDDTLPLAHSVSGFVYTWKQQPAQAIAESERAIALDPNDAGNYVGLANVLSYVGRSEEAIKLLEQAIRLSPRYSARYLAELGRAYRFTGRYGEAIATLKQGLLRNPNGLAFYSQLVNCYLQQWVSQLNQEPQTLQHAFDLAQKAIALSDSWPWSHIALGFVYLWQKQHEQALAEMEQGVALNPNNADLNVFDSYMGLAEVLSYGGSSEEAVEWAEKAVHLVPPYADRFLHTLGLAYYLAGRYAEVITPLKRFVTQYPNRLEAHLTLAAVYSELGKEVEARAEAAEVLRINPQFSLEVHKQRVPLKDPAALERHLAALRKAGLK